jgi:hypothetical protein
MMESKLILVFGLILVLLLAGCTVQDGGTGEVANGDEVTVTPSSDEIQVAADGTKYLVDPSDIQSGGPPQGGIGVDIGIPALVAKDISFVSIEQADGWIEDNELVLVFLHHDVVRVYPLQILVWHEIVNDNVAGDPILITYCPLCGSGIAYERQVKIDGVPTTTNFGTSGKLYNSNLVMYDQLTDTYWQQIDGKAIVGELVGQELTALSIDTVVWRDFKAVYTDAEVLSQDTGMEKCLLGRCYGEDPYGSYYEDSYLIFPVENEDDRIHPKTIIFGIEINGMYKAYKEEDLIVLGKIEDKVNGVPLRIERDAAGIVVITNDETGEEIVKERDMWFAWYAFHPDTALYIIERD